MSNEAIGEPAPDLLLLDENEATVRLSDYWGEGPLVVLFLRHYG